MSFSTGRSLTTDLAGIGWKAAVVVAALTIAWVAALALLPGAPADASAAERLRWLQGHPDGFAGPALVVAIAVVHVPVWLGLAAIVWPRRAVAGLMAVCIGLIYAPLALVAYWSQLTVVRGLVDLARTDGAAAATLYRVFEFPGGLGSSAYGIDVLAYAVWGVAAIAIAWGLTAFDDRLSRVTAWLWGASGMLAITGAIGFVTENDLLELGVLLSGVGFVVSVSSVAALLHRNAEAAAGSAGFSLRIGLPRAG